ncbi:MAG: M48 family metallopeptidase [Gammaproteobacteria bacterium]|nr:M48 family metallopeptidase [Gammaproteobacteria bacterium]
MTLFTQVFLFMFFVSFALQWWLDRRQISHIQANRAQVPAEFQEKISIEAHQKSADYTITKVKFSQISLIFSSCILLIWTIGGGMDVLDQWIRTFTYSSIISGLIFICAFSIISGILDLPFSLYHTFVIEEKFGFNKTTLKLFFTDMIKQLLLFIIIALPLIALILWLMQSMGTYWWIYAWAVWFGFSLLMMWIYPSFIAPLFNKFTELEDQSLKVRIEKLMSRCGFTSSGILVMDGSKRSSHGNAYFTGMGKNKRIVFFDNLLESLNAEEVEAVLAHELGHFKKKHITKRIYMMAAMTLAGFAVCGYLMNQQWFYSGLGISTPSIYMALILFMLVSSIFMFPFSPLGSLLSRKHEYEADDFAAQQADAQHLIDALVKLYKENYNTLTPDPIYSSWYDSHPPASLRIENLKKSAMA